MSIRDLARQFGNLGRAGGKFGKSMYEAGVQHPKSMYATAAGGGIGSVLASNAEKITPEATVDPRTGERLVMMPSGETYNAGNSGMSPGEFNAYWENVSAFGTRDGAGEVEGSGVDAGLLGTIGAGALAMTPFGRSVGRKAGGLAGRFQDARVGGAVKNARRVREGGSAGLGGAMQDFGAAWRERG